MTALAPTTGDYMKVVADLAQVQAERDLLQVERDQYRLEMRHLQRAVDELRAKIRVRAGLVDAAELAVIHRDLTDTGQGLDLLVGLHHTTTAAVGETAALCEVSEVIADWSQQELVGLLTAAIHRLADGEA